MVRGAIWLFGYLAIWLLGYLVLGYSFIICVFVCLFLRLFACLQKNIENYAKKVAKNRPKIVPKPIDFGLRCPWAHVLRGGRAKPIGAQSQVGPRRASLRKQGTEMIDPESWSPKSRRTFLEKRTLFEDYCDQKSHQKLIRKSSPKKAGKR